MKNLDKKHLSVDMQNEESHKEELGLSKREYFAGLALQGLLTIYDDGKNSIIPNESNVEYMAKLSVKAADVLLKELEQN